jgi:outer membrane protein
MHKINVILVFAFFSLGMKAQQTFTISVNEAVDIALKNVIEIKNLKLDEEIQLMKNKEVLATTRPQLSATGQISYYTNTPKIQFPTSDISVYQVLEKEGVKDANGNKIDVSKASFGSQAVSFFAPLNLQLGVGVSQLLFQPDVFVAYKARETVLEFARDNTKMAEFKVKEAVQKAYYNVLIAQKQKSVVQETKLRLDKLSSDMTQMYKSGFAEKLDIDKLQVTINNTTTAINQLDNAIKITRSLLKNTMGISQLDSLVLTEKLDVSELQAEMLKAEANFNYEQRSEIALLNTARKLQDLDLQRNKYSNLPTVAAFYNFQRQGQRNPDQLVNNSPWFWFNTGILGLSVNQKIYDGGQRKFKINQSKLALQKVENSIDNVKGLIDMEQQIAKSTLSNALLNLESQKSNVELAEKVFNTTKKKYEAGLGSSFEILQADTELQRSQGNYFQSLYDAYIAKVSYKKSLGNL